MLISFLMQCYETIVGLFKLGCFFYQCIIKNGHFDQVNLAGHSKVTEFWTLQIRKKNFVKLAINCFCSI